ncbi:hypothetical protein TNCT_82121 [Trichonephila clavata]|uniref:Uncharacterized protein n=1 Tax=Trichonephila clavata TaxID=2740835 RepID=A0A8X6KXF9_TRICU|nr:hypothetical protein TNCT_82121 [Trichonephila clavata]
MTRNSAFPVFPSSRLLQQKWITPLSPVPFHPLKSHGPPRDEKTVKFGDAPYFKTLTQRITSYVRLYNILTASLVFCCNNCSPRVFSRDGVFCFWISIRRSGTFWLLKAEAFPAFMK